MGNGIPTAAHSADERFRKECEQALYQHLTQSRWESVQSRLLAVGKAAAHEAMTAEAKRLGMLGDAPKPPPSASDVDGLRGAAEANHRLKAQRKDANGETV